MSTIETESPASESGQPHLPPVRTSYRYTAALAALAILGIVLLVTTTHHNRAKPAASSSTATCVHANVGLLQSNRSTIDAAAIAEAKTACVGSGINGLLSDATMPSSDQYTLAIAGFGNGTVAVSQVNGDDATDTSGAASQFADFAASSDYGLSVSRANGYLILSSH